MEWQIVVRLTMVISYVKWTASRKTEWSKLWWKDENSSTNSRSFKELLINKIPETSSSPGYKITNKKRTSYFYHIKFPHFLKELEEMTVVTQLQICFRLLCGIFSISLFALSLVTCNKMSTFRCCSDNIPLFSSKNDEFSGTGICLCRIKTGQTGLLEYKYHEIFVLVSSVICTLPGKVE